MKQALSATENHFFERPIGRHDEEKNTLIGDQRRVQATRDFSRQMLPLLFGGVLVDDCRYGLRVYDGVMQDRAVSSAGKSGSAQKISG
jgi:hypothetical protein